MPEVCIAAIMQLWKKISLRAIKIWTGSTWFTCGLEQGVRILAWALSEDFFVIGDFPIFRLCFKRCKLEICVIYCAVLSADLVGVDTKAACSLLPHGRVVIFILRPVTVVWSFHGEFLEGYCQVLAVVVVNQGLPEASLLCHEICCAWPAQGS